MKKCYSCGYEDRKDGDLCPVCGSPLFLARSDGKEIRSFKKYFLSAIIILAVSLSIFFSLRHGKTAQIIPEQELPAYPYEEKIERSIKALSGVIIPDYTEQETVFAYLENGSARLKLAACETLLYWAAYSKTSRQLYLKKAAQPLYGDFEKKEELIDMFIYFLSMKVFLPQELKFMAPQLSSIACSKDYKTAKKALRLAFITDGNAGLSSCCRSIRSSFPSFDAELREICGKSCSKS